MVRILRLSQALCLAAILAVAAAIVCGLVTAFAFSLYHEVRREWTVQYPGFHEDVRVLPDGTPVIERQIYYSGRREFLGADRSPLQPEPEPQFLEPIRL